LTSFIIAKSYTQCHFDHSLFPKKGTNIFTTLVLYVDEVILVGYDYLTEVS